ncbi:MAG: nicotinate (nicotinamide) nucleotide adenylyltransferase [Clostridia bacterium]|nr:nicotinate (nicotinamide) nucleotide adenylyltransferase [Clostridia bacterium]
MKIGIFGGTFNPPHKGHIRLVKEFTKSLSLDKVFIIPDKRPVHKTWEDLVIDDMRYEMCCLAFKEPEYEVSRMEIDRYSDSYTVYTLMQLKEQYPDGEFYLIIGSDMFLCFHKWYKHQVIMDNCTLCVASRDDEDSIYALRSYAFSQFRIYIKELEGRGIIISPMKPFKASSSEIRSIIKSGNDASEFLTAEVYDYIKKRGLYGYGKK